MSDGFEPHALGGLRGKRGAQAAGAEEHEALVQREHRLVILAVRIDPELQHAARAMESARHLALALQFAEVADVDQHHVGAVGEFDRLRGRHGFHLTIGGIHEGFVAGSDGLRHAGS